MPTYQTFSGHTPYPLSSIEFASFSINNLIEVIVDDYGNGSFVDRKTKLSTFYDFLVSSHPIFNKIDDVYNDRSYPEFNEYTNQTTYRYSKDIYISGLTYFLNNPYSTYNDEFKNNNLLRNQTVQKKQLEQYIHNHSLEIHAIKTEDTMAQYGEYGWDNSGLDEENPRIDNSSFVKLSKPHANCSISKKEENYQFYHSEDIKLYSNAFVTIVGKIKIPSNYDQAKRTPFYTPENNLWVGVMWNENSLVAISELHNIVDGIAYFSIQLPMAKFESYRVVTPFKPGDDENSIRSSSDATSSVDMFADIPINSFAIFYYPFTPSE